MIKIFALLIFLLLPFQSFACSETTSNTKTIYFPAKFDALEPEKGYVFQLLKLILKKSEDKYGKCSVSLADFKAPLKRMQYYLEKNKEIDVVALTVSDVRNNKLRPIKFPISKGLVGYRMVMIHQDHRETFATISTLEHLQQYVAGQGINWPDVEILQFNKIPVVTSGTVKTLVQMLTHKRFDYFPQGALQIGKVASAFEHLSVTVSDKLLISYPSMTALYVNKTNELLAQRLEYGLLKSYQDGSFNAFFNQHPLSKLALESLNLSQKHILYLCNPNIPDWAPLSEDTFWLKPWPEHIVNCNINSIKEQS